MNGAEEQLEPHHQHEALGKLEVMQLKSKSDVEEAIHFIGGHNILNEHDLLDETRAEQEKWLENLQSGVIDTERGAAIAMKENSKFVGFVLATPEGVITQFWSVAGREAAVLQSALPKLKDKGFDYPTVQLTEKSERAREIFLAAGFREQETKDGKVMMKKE